MTIFFVLVNPAVPENIGAAARAIKTMGFNRLRVVGSDQYRHKKARIVAHGASDVMDTIEHFEDLPAALIDMDWVIGTSSKQRLGKRHNYPASQLKGLVVAKGSSINNIAVVFGCEESGLSNQQLDCCDLLSSIPIAQSYPSLNLAQAVMIYAYSLCDVLTAQNDIAEISHGSWRELKAKAIALLPRLDVDTEDKLYKWSLERLSALNQKDIDFLHLLCNKLQKKLANDKAHNANH